MCVFCVCLIREKINPNAGGFYVVRIEFSLRFVICSATDDFREKWLKCSLLEVCGASVFTDYSVFEIISEDWGFGKGLNSKNNLDPRLSSC